MAGPETTFRWLRSGKDVFPPMLAAVEAAQSSIRLEMYIFKAAPPGEQFLDALLRARQRGVRVQVLLDALGSWSLPASFWQPLQACGGEFRWFNPIGLGRWAYRDHRKILVCDDRSAFVGGYNIAPEYGGDGVQEGWRDLGLQLSGPLAGALADAFDHQFARADSRHRRFVRLRRTRVRKRIATPDGQLFLSGPGRGHNFLKAALLRDLARARDVRVICAYFLPPRSVRRALRRVARRGGQVRLILPGRTDVALSRLAARGSYQRFLTAGVEIYEYQPQILHSKLFIFDDVVYVGSANLDIRSLSINYELLLRLPHAALAAEAREIFAVDLAHCQRIDPQAWPHSRTLWGKLKERWAFFVVARLDPYIARSQFSALP